MPTNYKILTFNLPNFTNRFIEGGNVGTYINPGLPDIVATGIFTTSEYAGYALLSSGTAMNYSTGSAGTLYQPMNGYFYASRYSNIYGQTTTVQPSSLCMNIIIKY